MVPVWFMLPLPSCLFAIGSLVHCVMFSLVIVLSCDYQFCLLIGWFLSCVQSCLLQVAMSLAVSQYQVRKVRRLWVQFPGNTHTENMYSLNAL